MRIFGLDLAAGPFGGMPNMSSISSAGFLLFEEMRPLGFEKAAGPSGLMPKLLSIPSAGLGFDIVFLWLYMYYIFNFGINIVMR